MPPLARTQRGLFLRPVVTAGRSVLEPVPRPALAAVVADQIRRAQEGEMAFGTSSIPEVVEWLNVDLKGNERDRMVCL